MVFHLLLLFQKKIDVKTTEGGILWKYKKSKVQ